MFAAIVSGRLVQSDFVCLSDSKFLLHLAPLDNVNHIVVFLTGAAAFPIGVGGGVYLGLEQNGELVWYFLGILTNERPSAIYKIGHIKKGAKLQNAEHPFGSVFGQPNPNVGVIEARLGISVEPLTELPENSEGSQSDSTNVDTMTCFTRFAAESLFNYVASFAHDSPSHPSPLVPISVIKGWFDTILHKLSVDPSFWRR